MRGESASTFTGQPGGRPPDGLPDATSASATLIASTAQSPAPGDTTVTPGNAGNPLLPQSAAPSNFSGVLHSSYAPHNAPSSASSEAAQPAQGGSAGTGATSSSRPGWSEDSAVNEMWNVVRAKYVEETIPTGFFQDGRIVLEELDYPDLEYGGSTLQQRVDHAVNIQFDERIIVYEDPPRRFRLSLADDVVALYENVANSLQALVDLCYQLPWPELAPRPPGGWLIDCIPAIGEAYYSTPDVARAFRYARDWIKTVALVVEIMLIMRPSGAYVKPPKKPNNAISKYANASPRPTPRPLPPTTPGTPAPVAAPTTIDARRVVIQSPRPDYSTPAQAMRALQDQYGGTAPAAPATGLTDAFSTVYGTVPSVPPPSLREAVLAAGAGPPLHAADVTAFGPPTSRGQVSQQLGLATPTTRPGSQYATPATGPAQFPFQTPERPAGHVGSLPAITPGQLGTAAPALRTTTPYGAPPPPDPFDHYTRSQGFPQPGQQPAAAGGGLPPVGNTTLPYEHRPPSSHGSGGGGGWFPPPGGGGPPNPPGPGGGGHFPGGGPPGGGPPYGGGGQPPGGGLPHGGGPPPGGAPPGAGPPGGGGYPAAGGQHADEPRFDVKFKADSLPQWDGNFGTAIDYFAKLRRWADLGGQIPTQIGSLAPTRFTGRILFWWDTISEGAKQAYGANVYTLMAGIRYAFLSESWSRKLIDYFHAMEFREKNHEHETPVQFLQRRTVLCNALWIYNERDKVHHVLTRAPVEWLAVLNEHNVPSVDVLFRLATELERQLTVAAAGRADIKQLVREYLDELAQKSRSGNRQFVRRTAANDPGRPAFRAAPPNRSAFIAQGDEVSVADLIQFDENYNPADLATLESAKEAALAQQVNTSDFLELALQAEGYLAERAKADTTDKHYAFARDTRESERKPPSPCRACGGPHWNKECRHWAAFEAQRKKNPVAYVAGAAPSIEQDMIYDLAYAAYCSGKNDILFSSYDPFASLLEQWGTHYEPPGSPRETGTSQAAELDPAADVNGLLSLFTSPQAALEQLSPARSTPSPTMHEEPDRWHLWYLESEKLPADGASLLVDEQQHQRTYRERSPLRNNPKVNSLAVVPLRSALQVALTADIARAADPLLPHSGGRPIEVAEDAFHAWYAGSLKASHFILEPDGDGFFETSGRAIFAAALNAEHLLPPPPLREVEIIPKRHPPPGMASVGMGVLSAPGRLGGRDERVITLRLDSGASISLVSEAYLKRLKHPPKVHTGLRITLAQLTDQSPRIRGYVNLPVRVTADDGTGLVFSAELYVVPDMTVEVLLGEDFQLSNELNVLRSVDLGSKIQVGKTGYSFEASSLARPLTEAEARDVQMARALRVVLKDDPSFVSAKWHRRMRANRHRRKKALNNGALRAWKDTLIPAETTVRIPVAGDLQYDREWFVERNLISVSGEAFLTVPNCLLEASSRDAGYAEPGSIGRRSMLPVTNPTKTPRIVRAGTLLGYAKDPQQTLDCPGSEQGYTDMEQRARAMAALITALDATGKSDAAGEGVTATTVHQADAPGVAAESVLQKEALGRSEAPTEDATLATDELEHPARAEAPDPAVYPSADLEQILDIAPDVPAAYRKQLLELLHKRVKAFGFDGRLGHLDAAAKVRTKDGANPVSEPMHGASPEKRQVIEEQLTKWFELGVIEPSKSPWAAPVVIVYRNGKARFCVDYRKLNAVTVPDEFPIPRQNDILSALSGSQVLSSLDALAGFNQIEMDPEDVEKTAFRTHLGLFQFRRMPFGLRNGPAIFQRIMQSILAPFLWLFVLVYIDDIVVYSPSYEDHLDHLDRVLGAIETAGLTLSPAKCHFMYSSILLLGHKVSRLGLSTHQEKVSAITELERPRNLQTLQIFLGMIVYFQAFIPYYSFIVSPLFRLLKKGAKWEWGEVEEHAFREAKQALQAAPVLGHPVRGRPYRLYTDASDEALGACLQQVQDIRAGDLVGTPAYDKLKAAFEAKQEVPSFVARLNSRAQDILRQPVGGPTLDETVIETERVISYWSRTFKGAERNYSATEREALAAKEALVKFQPFVEGEKVILVTDHSALQWARTFENANRRLASWGLVFNAHSGLEIIHRAGRLHSNVDPLSRLPRDEHTQMGRLPPEHTSPAKDTTPSIFTDFDLAELRERAASNEPAPRMVFANLAFCLADLLEPARAAALAVTRSQAARERPSVTDIREARPNTNEGRAAEKAARRAKARPLEQTAGMRYEDALKLRQQHPPPTLQLVMDPDEKAKFRKGYEADPAFKDKGGNSDERSWYAGNRFYKGSDGLLYFRDADFMPRLCVPRSEQPALLRRMHESPNELAHAGPAKSYLRLAERFYWPRMRKDIEEFCKSCDHCQKTKDPNFKRFGLLQPHLIPDEPYARISLDLVTGLPLADGFNAILVIIDRLTKHAQFIPTDTGLDTVKFAELFIRHVVNRFGVPIEMIADRDGRWLSHFFAEVAKQLKLHLLLSSSHHPQHDGQTERTNRTMETMLRSYAAEDPGSWPQWLSALEFAYNNTTHASTGETPYFLLYGFKPRSPVDLLVPVANGDSVARGVTAHKQADSFLEQFEARRQSARDSIAHAQHVQAQAYNRGRRALELQPGDLVLLRPKSLELVESRGEGVKLMQKAIGPFAVQERVGDATYRIDLPSTFPMSNVIHLEHLRPYHPSPDRFGERNTMKPPRWTQEAAQEYQVEQLISHRRNRTKGQVEYLTRWEGYGPEHDSWLTARELRNAPARLLDYRRHHGL